MSNLPKQPPKQAGPHMVPLKPEQPVIRNRATECMIQVIASGLKVRVWIRTDQLRRPTRSEYNTIKKIVEEVFEDHRGPNIPMLIAEAIGVLPECEAVEVTGYDDGCGLLLYPDWK